jgi:hypothetical protein
VTRLLASAAVAVGLLATFTPAAQACQFSQCTWGRPVCNVVHCPIYCREITVVDRRICIAQ